MAIGQVQAPAGEAANYGLGACRGFHKRAAAGLSGRWMLGVGLLAVYVFIVGMAAGVGLANLLKHEEHETVLGLPLGALAAGLVVWWLWRVKKRRDGDSVALCEEGMIVTERGKIAPIRWDEIAALSQKVQTLFVNGIKTGTTFQYTLSLRNGATRKIYPQLERIAELGAAIDSEVTRRLLPSYVAMFDAGQPIVLGEFTLTRQGIARYGQLLPWEQVANVYPNAGFLIVTSRARSAAALVAKKTLEGVRTAITSVAGTRTPMSARGEVGWAKAPAAKIPNLSILLRLASQCQGVRFE